jgi:hypothetical protein
MRSNCLYTSCLCINVFMSYSHMDHIAMFSCNDFISSIVQISFNVYLMGTWLCVNV